MQDPEVLALIADPRVITLDDASADSRVAVAVTIDPNQAWHTPILLERTFDLLSGSRLRGVLPPGTDPVWWEINRSGSWQPLRSFPGVEIMAESDVGAGAFELGDSLDRLGGGLPPGARLRVRTSTGDAAEFATRPIPAAVKRRSFRFASGMTARDRRAFRRAVASASPAARRLIAQLDDFTTVSHAARLEGGAAGRAGQRPEGGWSVQINTGVLRGDFTAFKVTVLHELGHLVEFAGIDERDAAALDRTIPRRGRCKYDPEHPVVYQTGPCAARSERFADTFAKWALNMRAFKDVGYSVATPKSFRPFARTLNRAFRLTLYLPHGMGGSPSQDRAQEERRRARG